MINIICLYLKQLCKWLCKSIRGGESKDLDDSCEECLTQSLEDKCELPKEKDTMEEKLIWWKYEVWS